MPFCRTSLGLEVGSNYFVEIENQLPGTPQYNRLIKHYARKNWSELDSAIAEFRAEFESSPLIEAIEFLDLQAQIEQASEEKEADHKKLESRFRDLLVLYPRSSLAPVLSGTLANFYLRQGIYPKALGLYKSSRELFPFHDSGCAFLLGEAEANYGIGNMEEAASGFKAVNQKCRSGRLQLGAQLRLIDIERDQAGVTKQITQKYEKLVSNNPSILPRLYPEVLINLAELKYRARNYPSASFYLQDYNRNAADQHPCRPTFLKRIADVSLHRDRKTDEVVGNYLSVFEKYPKTDLGKFSRALSYLLELQQVSDQESERRMEIVNADINSLQNTDLKSSLEIYRGLALLDRGEDAGLEAVGKLKPRYPEVFKGEVDSYVRKKLLTIYQARTKALSSQNEKTKDRHILEPLENSFSSWFEKTEDEYQARVLYRGIIKTRFSDALSGNSPKKAIQKLERWNSSPLFSSKLLDSDTKAYFAESLAEWWIKQKESNPQGVASALVEKSKELRPFLKPVGEALWYQAHLDLQMPAERGISSLEQNLKSPPGLAILLGRAYRESKQFARSQAILEAVSGKVWLPFKTIELMKTWNKSGEAQKAISVGQKNLSKVSGDYRTAILDLMRDSVLFGKQWKQSGSVLELAKSLKLTDRDLVPFYTMDGKASFERAEFTHSKLQYEKAIQIYPESPSLPESRFQLGHCLYRLKDIPGAKKQWEQVVALNDSFWSPLAKNELKMLETP